MKKRLVVLLMVMNLIIIGLVGCGNHEEGSKPEGEDTVVDVIEVLPQEKSVEEPSNYYLNEQGILVDKVEEFKTQTLGEYTLTYPILEDGVDEVVVYEFDTDDNTHVVLDASNIYQQVSLNTEGDYGDVQLEIVASDEGIVYMYDGERYYIEDDTIDLLTISDLIQ